MGLRATMSLEFGGEASGPLIRKPRDWNGFSAEIVELSGGEPYAYKYEGSSHFMCLHDILLRDGELSVSGLATLTTRDLRDTVTFVPKGCAVEGWSDPDRRKNSFVAMYFDPEAMREDLGSKYSRDEPAPFAYSRDPHLRSTLKKLETLLRIPEVDELHAESVSLLATLEVFGVVADSQGRLSDRQVSMVTDFVEGHLHGEISLADMASVAGLSRFHFSRAFKATTGESPYAFVQRRRIARASRLLKEGQLSIEAIASSVGFNGSLQFARAFREITGVSPSKYRVLR
ncbi:helix-turn-helix transcriptional regulator [Rhizobium skierniewicense]|nr:helix-turn-helix transcriptional regulator [Rhizobium skierniewicense]